MLTFQAKKMGFVVVVLDPTPNSPAGQVADAQIVADYKDESAIRQLAAQVDYVTFEIELANAAILDELTSQGTEINPAAKTLAVIKDKLLQKEFLAAHTIPTAEFFPIETAEDILQAVKTHGFPLFVKARFDGYDGRGNAKIESESDIPRALQKLAGRTLYGEAGVEFIKELSVVVARSTTGEVASYPVVETVHQNNICHVVYAPAPIASEIQQRARRLAEEVMQHLGGAGVFCIEMFLTSSGQVIVNEIAPRVHNAGHFSIEACHTDQFEQHIRAITGLPLGDTEMKVPAAVMINILGAGEHLANVEGLATALAIPQVSVHIYGKAETRAERKMGHVTATGPDLDTAFKNASRARQLLLI